MRRVALFVTIFAFSFALWWWQRPAEQKVVHQARPSAVVAQRSPAQLVVPTRPKPIPRPVERVAMLRLPAHARVENPERRELSQNNRRYKFLSGVVAISERDLPAGVEILSRRQTLVLINAADAPAGAKTMEIVERQDNRSLGIFTGTLKAIAKATLESENVLTDCGCQVKERYPAIKSYLLLPSDASNTSELKDCLGQSGLFKRLDWEILEAPRLSR